MASQLRTDATNLKNNQFIDVETTNTHIQMYNNIRGNIVKKFPDSSIANNLPYLSMSYSQDPLFRGQPNTHETFTKLISVTGQVIAFLEAILEDPDKKFEALNNEIFVLKEKNLKIEGFNRITSESLNKYIKAEEFPVSEEILGKIPKDILPTLHDALRAYGAGSYTASVCVCRNIIQGLVQEQCAKEDIKENGLNKQIEALISTKKIKQKHNQTLLDTVATLGHRSAHPTTEVFTKEKAALVLNGLLILIDEVFT